MIKGYINKDLSHYYDLTEKIASMMLNRLENKFYFKSKLNITKVSIYLVGEGDISGECVTHDPDNTSIIIRVNTNTPQPFVEFIIAHELSHLLFCCYDSFGDYCSTDNSFAISGIKRIIDNGINGDVYGHNLEEILCDWIATDIVLQLHAGNLSLEEFYEIFIPYLTDYSRNTLKNYLLADHFINLFSNSPDKPLTHYNALLTVDDFIFPHNFFLYGSCNNHLNWFIYEYDKLHGDGAWKKMVIAIDILVDAYCMVREEEAEYAKEYQEECQLKYQQEVEKYLKNPILP